MPTALMPCSLPKNKIGNYWWFFPQSPREKKIPIYFDQKKSPHDLCLKKLLQLLHKDNIVERYYFDIVSGKPKVRVTEEREKGKKREKFTTWKTVEEEELLKMGSQKVADDYLKFKSMKKRKISWKVTESTVSKSNTVPIPSILLIPSCTAKAPQFFLSLQEMCFCCWQILRFSSQAAASVVAAAQNTFKHLNLSLVFRPSFSLVLICENSLWIFRAYSYRHFLLFSVVFVWENRSSHEIYMPKFLETLRFLKKVLHF